MVSRLGSKGLASSTLFERATGTNLGTEGGGEGEGVGMGEGEYRGRTGMEAPHCSAGRARALKSDLALQSGEGRLVIWVQCTQQVSKRVKGPPACPGRPDEGIFSPNGRNLGETG